MLRNLPGAAIAAWVLLAWVLVSAPSFAAEPVESSSESISNALCGRQDSKERVRADAINAIVIADVWKKTTLAELQRWLEAPLCTAANEPESSLFKQRQDALRQLQARTDRARVIDFLEEALKPFRDRTPLPEEWPTLDECKGCDELRKARRAAIAASHWPARKQSLDGLIQPWLDEAEKREPLIRKLCDARPAVTADDEIERRFQYYTWTLNGLQLLATARWFERPEIAAACR